MGLLTYNLSDRLEHAAGVQYLNLRQPTKVPGSLQVVHRCVIWGEFFKVCTCLPPIELGQKNLFSPFLVLADQGIFLSQSSPLTVRYI